MLTEALCARLDTVNMLIQACGYLAPHRIKYEIYATSARILCGRYEVRVARDEDDLRDEITFGQRSNIETNTHIDSLCVM